MSRLLLPPLDFPHALAPGPVSCSRRRAFDARLEQAHTRCGPRGAARGGGLPREGVATVVRSGASCASACAQILFLSGAHRTIEGSGRLGLHSCHTAGDRSRSVACNELIAQNALARGTPYASIMVFLHLTGPTQMKWLGAAEAGPLGFTRKPPDVPQVASAYRM